MFDIATLPDALAVIDGRGRPEAELIDMLGHLERLKSAAAAAQARVTVTLADARAAREAAAGVPAERRCQGLASEIALARRCSPHRGARDLGLARALVREMPATLAALTRGDISEWRATLVVRETAVLSREHRAEVDTELDGRLGTLGDRGAAGEARRIGYRLDPGSALRRCRGAVADRYVSLRPAPDTMTHLTGFLPVAQGVACLAALRREADSRRAQGDERSRSQIMADTMVQRLTGQASADAVGVEVSVVMSESSLFAGADTPARIPGFGPLPAAVARGLVREADRAWIRRLYTHPGDGRVVAVDSRRRCFSGELRGLVIARDDVCRTPWCDAPIRHVDHVVRAADEGETSADNGQGLCETCNYAKEATGWSAHPRHGPPHEVVTTTPTGHRYVSTVPGPPPAEPEPERESLGDIVHVFGPHRTEEELLRLLTA